MKRWMVLFSLLIFVLMPAFSFAQSFEGKGWKLTADDTDKIVLNIRPVYKGKPLTLGIQYYVNAHGDTFYIDRFKFYITNIGFKGFNRAANANLTNSHLFDAEDKDTYSFLLENIPRGDYGSLTFVAGVDSVDNTSGANEGDLDPVKGMYWAWNSGYIMAKLEGHSKVCKTLHNAFEFHIGGYMPPYNAARQVSVDIREWTFPVKRARFGAVIIADVAAWIDSVDLSKVNSILIPGKGAAMMADNYAKMFSLGPIFSEDTPIR